ncbi:MAG: T9SS type A sorting domain-containing protein [Bacteroidetes bacterium]|nr:T9SS type A sorting domain-containing protein [Bacteroidota bacterium]
MKYFLKNSLLVTAAVFFFSIPSISSAQSFSNSAGIRKEGEGNENIKDRLKYEFMMLRDPVTNKIPGNIRKLELEYAKTLPTVEEVPMEKGMEKVQSSTWTSLGPSNVGGRTRALAVDVSNENVILAGGVSGGMWRSSDGGQSWNKTTGSDQMQNVSCITQDTRQGHTNIFYYGTGELYFNTSILVKAPYRGNGIYKSTDDGMSWFPLPSTQVNSPQSFMFNFQYVWRVATDPSNSIQDVLYAATFGGIYKSTNGGATWNLVLGDSSKGCSFTDIKVTSTGVVYATLSNDAGTHAGIWKSTTGDKGSFVNITPAAWPIVYNRIVLDAAASDENQVYFLAETPGAGKVLPSEDGGTDGYSLWKYTDGTKSPWEDRSSYIPALGGLDGNFDSQYSADLLIKVKPDDPNFVIIGGTNLYRSTDGFATPINISNWIGGYATTNDNYDYSNQHPDEHALVFLPSNPKVVYSGNDGGISKTNDVTSSQVTWISLNNGYITSQFYSVAMDQSANGDNVVIGGMQDNGNYYFNSTNPSSKWNVLPEGGDGTITAIANNKTFYYIGEQNGYVQRLTLDDQGNALDSAEIEPKGGTNFLFVTPYLLDPNISNIMYLAAGDSVWRNSDLSKIPDTTYYATDVNWTVMNNTAKGDVITAIGISKTPANILYYGTESGGVYKVNNSNTGDPIPIDIWSGKGLSDGAYVTCIAVDQDNANNVMLVYSNYNVISLYYSSDGGNSWQDVAGNLEQNPDGSGDGPSCRWATILNVGGATYYFVATSTGVYSTTQLNGTSTVWAQEGANTIGNVVSDMVISRETDGKLVVATHGNGVYYTKVSASTPVDSSNILLSFDNNMTPTKGIFSVKPNLNKIIANRLTAPSITFKITKLMYYITADHSGGAGSFSPYEDACANYSNGVLGPATYGVLFDNITPSNIPGWDTVNVSISVNPTTPNSKEFFVGVIYDGTHEPVIGYDSTSSNGRGWYNDGNIYHWTQLDSLTPVPWHVTLYIRAEISTVTGIVDIGTEVPKNFNLSQNYPNPFNPTTTIEYDLPKGENVKLKVYDILGREVAELVDAYQAAGTYKVQWNGRNNSGTNLASGIYLYTFEAGSYKSVKKMIYLK